MSPVVLYDGRSTRRDTAGVCANAGAARSAERTKKEDSMMGRSLKDRGRGAEAG
jgi:hypothetical protein